MTILFYLSLAAAVILLVNVRSRGWSLPAVAVGLWVFVALVIGVLYPTFLQALKVSPGPGHPRGALHPARHHATRAAFGLDKVEYHTSLVLQTIIAAKQVKADAATLANIRLWDPAQQHRARDGHPAPVDPLVLHLHDLSVDRYDVNGKVTPVLIGARQINSVESALAELGQHAPAVHPR